MEASKDYKYDLAISFLAGDEALATRLADQFEGGMKIFVYSKQQERLGGTDGEMAFSSVFQSEARLVVVLYRAGWGETSWTRIEETAIRNRGFDEGYDFALFIPLDQVPSVPKWLPKNRIWIGLERWGIECAAAVIDARHQEIGGVPRQETLEDGMARLEREAQFLNERRRYLNSDAGVTAATAEYTALREAVRSHAEQAKMTSPSLEIEIKQAGEQLVIVSTKISLAIGWRKKFANVLTGARVEARAYRGHPPFPGIISFEEPTQVGSLTLEPDLSPPHHPSWKTSFSSKAEPVSSHDAAELLIRWWLGHVHKQLQRKWSEP